MTGWLLAFVVAPAVVLAGAYLSVLRFEHVARSEAAVRSKRPGE